MRPRKGDHLYSRMTENEYRVLGFTHDEEGELVVRAVVVTAGMGVSVGEEAFLPFSSIGIYDVIRAAPPRKKMGRLLEL